MTTRNNIFFEIDTEELSVALGVNQSYYPIGKIGLAISYMLSSEFINQAIEFDRLLNKDDGLFGRLYSIMSSQVDLSRFEFTNDKFLDLRLVSLLVVLDEIIKDDNVELLSEINTKINILSYTNLHHTLLSLLFTNSTVDSKVLSFVLNSKLNLMSNINFRDFVLEICHKEHVPDVWINFIKKNSPDELLLFFEKGSKFNYNAILRDFGDYVVEITPNNLPSPIRVKYLGLAFIDNPTILDRSYFSNRIFISNLEMMFYIFYSLKFSLETEDNLQKLVTSSHFYDDNFFMTFVEFFSELLISPSNLSQGNIGFLKSFVKIITNHLTIDDVLNEFYHFNDKSILCRLLHLKPVYYSEQLVSIKSMLHRKFMFRRISKALLLNCSKNKITKI